MLPVLNRHAVTLTIKAGLALGSTIAKVSSFDRKHYFYPDLPKGYQITQMYQPLVGKGKVEVPDDSGGLVPVRIHHAHLEEDAGKLTHYSDYSLVDLNRAGTPLLEIVSEPDIHNATLARAYAQELYLLMTYSGVTRGDLYHGNMRFDVNVSVAKKDAKAFGTRAEIKNLNSFRSVEKVVEYEFKRQVELLEKGQTIIQETRGWDEAKQKTVPQRGKEAAHDYRYMPEPDVPPLMISKYMVGAIEATMPMLPAEYRRPWQSIGLNPATIATLLARPAVASTIYSIQLESGDNLAKIVANWYANTLTESNERDNQVEVDAQRLTELAVMFEKKQLSSTAAKEIFVLLLGGNDDSPRHIAEAHNLLQLSDEAEIEKIVETVLNDPSSQQAIADIKSGNDKAIGFLVGQVMKLSKGKANPGLVQKLLRKNISN